MRRLNLTRTLPVQNKYTRGLEVDYAHRAFSEERAPLNRGLWREKIFQVSPGVSLDLEIGTGNGFHFTHRALNYKERCLVGLEIKYKPLYQAIKRTLVAGALNASMCRAHAFNLSEIFSDNEVDDIFIHFPDPWTSPLKPKNRIVQKSVLEMLSRLQKPGARIEFKTDSREMFDWALLEIEKTNYKILFKSYDLHQSEIAKDNFVTFFESLFLKEGLPINYILLENQKD